MVSDSDIAHGVCLGRSANDRFFWVGNWWKQHQRRSEHNHEQDLNNRHSEQHGCRNASRRCCQSDRGCSRSDERDGGWTINHNHPEQSHDRNEFDRNRIDLHKSEHHRHKHDRCGGNDDLRYAGQQHDNGRDGDNQYRLAWEFGWNDWNHHNRNRGYHDRNFNRDDRNYQLLSNDLDHGNGRQQLNSGRNCNLRNDWKQLGHRNCFDHRDELHELLFNHKLDDSALND